MKLIDLHVHSLASDGTFSPSALVDYAIQKRLSAFALTDHDTVAGIEEALAAANDKPVRVIPGIEISCQYNGQDIHMLGLNINYKDSTLLQRLSDARKTRDTRNDKMIALLAANGFDISKEQIAAEFPDAVITRSHIAKHLMYKGYVSSITDGFDRYVGPQAPYYIPRERISPETAITWIHDAGGRAVMAHPLLYHLPPEELDTLTASLKDARLDGLEAIYSRNEGEDEQSMCALAARHGLAISGGSDFHGKNKPGIDLGVGRGNLSIPESLLGPLGLA